MRKRSIFFSLIMLTLILLAGCEGETPIPQVVRDPGWAGLTVNTVCLVVNESYPGLSSSFSLPVKSTTERILRNSGIKVVRVGQDCDATLTIDFTAEARSESYIGILGGCAGELYTGASAHGSVALATSDRQQSWAFSRGLEPARGTSKCREHPEQAPFYQVWAGALLDGLMQIWGTRVAIEALYNGDEDVSRGGVQALSVARYLLPDEQLGPEEMEAVPGLIDALDEVSYGLANTAAELLKIITGQDFGTDKSRWEAWWKAQD